MDDRLDRQGGERCRTPCESNPFDTGRIGTTGSAEWVIENPGLLDEDLLVVTSEYDGFERTRDRLDVLALDRAGKLAVVELKRDEADRTTDLQAIEYASYCATLTPREVQELYREFWSDRRDEPLRSEDVGGKFADFLNETADEEVSLTEDGWAEFDLDDKP